MPDETPEKKPLTDVLGEKVLVLDGAMGTEIYRRHVFVNVCFDELSVTRPDLIRSIHADYVEAGADLILTNTFGANRFSLAPFGLAEDLEKINQASVSVAQEVAEAADHPVYVAGSIGPITPERPDREGVREEIIEALAEQARILWKAGVDILLFETQHDRTMIERCGEAMREMPDVPYGVSFTIMENGESAAGEPLDILVAPMPEGCPQPIAWGMNCGVGPAPLLEATKRAVALTELPLLVKPNAGRPREVGNRMIYMCSPEYLAEYAKEYVQLGVAAVGGCCGTRPDHIREMAQTLKPLTRTRVKVEEHLGEACELKEEKPLEDRSRFGWHLAHGRWVNTVELVPPRGWDLSDIVAKAGILHRHGIDAVNLPDGPRASSRISPLTTALKIQQEGHIEAILHFCCRDRNLIGMQADLLACAASGVHNILFVTGDPPKLGSYTTASGVFDADSIGMVGYQKRLNRGADIGGKEIDPPTEAVIGVGADPTMLDMDREVRRYHEKVEAGAEFAITQPVFDPDALFRFLDRVADTNIPVIAGIWPLASLKNALFMQNEVPGVEVPEAYIERIGKHESREDQKKVGVEIARQSVEAARDRVAGIQVSAPFGNVHTALAVIED